MKKHTELLKKEFDGLKIGIIAVNNLKYSPYVNFYVDICTAENIDCEVIYPDRNGINDTCRVKTICLPWKSKANNLVNYLRYFSAVKKTVKKQKYDYLIMLTSISAVFMSKLLKKNYKGKYIVDIRDYTHEKISLYSKFLNQAVNNSDLNVISSRKFTTFLPKSEYLVCHNINVPNDDSTFKFNIVKNKKIIIGYVGAIAYVEQCKNLMNLVKDDLRFEFHFYGTGNGEKAVREYLDTLNCKNIQMFGAYNPSEKGSIIQKTDILFNAYGNGTYLVDTALSNKLYDALYYRKLLLTSPETYMSEIACEMAYSIDFSKETDLSGLYNWICNRDFEKLDLFAEKLFNELKAENEDTKATIRKKLSA